MTKLVVAIAVGICMGGFSALSVSAEEPEAPEPSLTVQKPEDYEGPGITTFYLVNEFFGSQRFMGRSAGKNRLAESRHAVDKAVRSGLEEYFPEFGPRLRLAQIVLTMLEGKKQRAVSELNKLSVGYKDNGSCVSGFTIAAMKFAEAEFAYQTEDDDGFGKHATAAEYAYSLRDRGEYCAREAHKLSAAYYILLAEEYLRQEHADEAIKSFMKAIAVAHNDVDSGVEERVLRFVALSFDTAVPHLADELRLRADKIWASTNRSEQATTDHDTVIYGVDYDLPVNEDPSIILVYVINALSDRYRAFSRQR